MLDMSSCLFSSSRCCHQDCHDDQNCDAAAADGMVMPVTMMLFL